MDKAKEQLLIKALEKVSPGTELREGLEYIISSQTGALIVIGDVKAVMKLSNGGFEVNCEFTPQKLFELAKMDGAIILDEEASQILLANVHLIPDASLPTNETGMRHRTAERVARQTKALVISISQARDVVSLYVGDVKHILEAIPVILAKANQALQTLEKYKIRLDQVSSSLSALEFEDLVTLLDVTTVVQRAEMVERVAREIERYISELGHEGRLIKMQLEELIGGVAEDKVMVVRDYCVDVKKAETIAESLAELSSEELFDPVEICRFLGYEESDNVLEFPVHPRGYRLLRKIPRLPITVVSNLVEQFSDLQTVLQASIEELDRVEGVGEVRAKAIQEGLKRLKEYNLLERYV